MHLRDYSKLSEGAPAPEKRAISIGRPRGPGLRARASEPRCLVRIPAPLLTSAVTMDTVLSLPGLGLLCEMWITSGSLGQNWGLQ